MAKTKKPTHTPSLPFPSAPDALHQEGHWLWIPLRKEWRDVSAKPEEVVRQKFIRTLVEHYGYALEQMDQEQRTQHGHRSPRADIVIWQSVDDRTAKRFPVLVVECKTDTIEIQERDYYQAASYTVASGCEIFIATNQRHTAVFKLVARTPGEFVAINEIPKASDWGDAKRLKEVLDSLRAFNRKEFQDLLFVCHSILRDVHKMDPGRAFDTISKILFIKMYVERSGQHGTFTTDYLDRRAAVRLPTDPAVHDGLFDQTKAFYRADDLFTAADKLDISEETFRRIVKQLERFDLSKTGDDIKGLAFEKFLGTTFRGELGQFFTPRPVVEFMVDLLNPQETQLICDPASGSGGFLIRAFEHVRAQIVADIQRQKDEERARIEALGLPEDLQRCRERGYGSEWEQSHHRLLQAAASKTPILDLFEIGKGKNNRPTELIFVERCLNLLKPGGRMGIVLPDGNLNNPSLAWLRRWAEGRAKLLAVVSLPEETFKSSNATVKASLVFLRKFTDAESAQWEAAWAQAHAELDAGFDTQRNDAHGSYAPRIVSGEDADATRLLAELDALGLRRTLPRWQRGEAPAYPQQAKPTMQGKPFWLGEVAKEHKKAAAELKKQATAALADVQKHSDALLSELKARYKAIDEAHTAALWARVRELFDYPVFVAAPKTVGITSTGDTGEGVASELPDLLKAYREFEHWLAQGAQPEATPNFPVPSAA